MADQADESSPRSSSPPNAGSTTRTSTGTANFLSERRTDLILNVVRLLVVVFFLGYVTGLGGKGAFYKALIAMAAASALRLYQRTREAPGNRADRTWAVVATTVLAEDSCHHLMYCILFLIGSPVTFVLVPITLFAFLHSMAFFVKLGNEMNVASGVVRPIGRLIEAEQQRMLMMAAMVEIMLMPLTIGMVATGKIMLVAPFMYYRFLQLRYRSRRNPYCRLMFTQLRMAAERLAQRSPPAIGNVISKGIGLVSRLAPPVAV
ncbi:hypothetical protein RvY_04891 [Ramazzottius varieornatus]|uniref:Transmembrane protein 33 n=1 Tax=Ramazzottius varieornatus TaxID=947166 RepID=A0A1D1UT56_RAMVA|nr:hypothetical protein RvY_04891 [Ramazzottius varieornatus]